MNKNNETAIRNNDIDDGFSTSISLTDKVKNLFENLIIEDKKHTEIKNNYFEELLKIWEEENRHKDSSNQPENCIFIGCKDYILSVLTKHLENGEDQLYAAYYSVQKFGQCEIKDGDITTVYDREILDIREMQNYIGNLKRKIERQYENLRHQFKQFLIERQEAEIMENQISVVDRIRLPSQRKVTTVQIYTPTIKFNKKTKKRKTMADFLKVNTLEKKRKVL
jgi:hypothetical protein